MTTGTNRPPRRCTSLAWCLALALPLAANVQADEDGLAATRQELRETQAELGALAARLAELSARVAGDDVARLLAHGPGRPVLGVVLQPDPQDGVRLAAVTPGGPAAEAGLRPGERLRTINGERLQGGSAEQRMERAQAAIGPLREGDVVRLEVEGDSGRRRIEVAARKLPGTAGWALAEGELAATMAARLAEGISRSVAPAIAFDVGRLGPLGLCEDGGQDCMADMFLASRALRGLRLAALNPQLGRYFGSDRGVLVLETGAALGDLQPGDVVLAVDGEAVDSPRDALRALRGQDAGERRRLRLLRDRQPQELEVAALRYAGLPLLLPLAPLPPTPPAAPAAPAPAVAPTPRAAPSTPPPPPPRLSAITPPAVVAAAPSAPAMPAAAVATAGVIQRALAKGALEGATAKPELRVAY